MKSRDPKSGWFKLIKISPLGCCHFGNNVVIWCINSIFWITSVDSDELIVIRYFLKIIKDLGIFWKSLWLFHWTCRNFPSTFSEEREQKHSVSFVAFVMNQLFLLHSKKPQLELGWDCGEGEGGGGWSTEVFTHCKNPEVGQDIFKYKYFWGGTKKMRFFAGRSQTFGYYDQLLKHSLILKLP